MNNSESTALQNRYLRFFRRWLGFVVSLISVGIIIWFLRTVDFAILQNISLSGLALISLVVILGHLIIAWKLRLSVAAFNVHLPFVNAFLLVQAGAFLNIIPLNLGTGLRAVYLKKVLNLDYVEFGLGFIGLIFSSLISAGIIGLLFSSTLGLSDWWIYAVFAIYIVLPALLFGISIGFQKRATKSSKRLFKMNFLNNLATRGVEGIEKIKANKEFFLYWVILDLLANLSLGTRFWIISGLLDYPYNFSAGMVLQSFTRVSAIITLVPSGTLGIREFLTGLGSLGIGGAIQEGLLIATLDRLIATSLIIVLGTISLFIVRRQIDN